MSATTDPTTLAITGALPGVLLGGALLALPVSLLLLWLYRRAVLRSMNAAARGGDATAKMRAASVAGPANALNIAFADARSVPDAAPETAGRDARALARRGRLRSRRARRTRA